MRRVFLIALLLLSVSGACLSESPFIELSDTMLGNLSSCKFSSFCEYLSSEVGGSPEFYAPSPNQFCIQNAELHGTNYSLIECTQYKDDMITLSLHHTCELGETISDSDTYVSTVNSFVSKYGNPTETDYDLHMKLLYGRSLSWILEEQGIQVTILYHDGDVSNNVFPEIEIRLFEFFNH